MAYRVLVTGGAGYLGSVLVPELLKSGHSVTVIDNFMYRPASLMECCGYKNFEVVPGDAREKKLLESLVKGKDFIIPLAALVGAPLCNQDKIAAQTTNSDAIKMLVEIMSPDQKLIIPITNSGYGVGQKGIYCTEETSLNPISFYGKTKVEAEQVALSRENSVSLRLATVFGSSSRMRIDLLVNDFVYRAVKDKFIIVFEGHFKRNYIHIRDVAIAFMHTIEKFEIMKGQAYNVGLSDTNISKLELCAKIKKYVPGFVYLESPFGEDPDKRDYIVSNEKIEKTGYKPKYSLEDGISELLKTYAILNNSKYSNV